MCTQETTAHIHGSVSLREPSVVPSGAVLTVTLEDVSRVDAMSDTLGVCVIDALETLPSSFSIPYDRALIVARHAYGVRARIEHEGSLLYTTDTNHPVLTRGAPNTIHLSLVPASTGGRP